MFNFGKIKGLMLAVVPLLTVPSALALDQKIDMAKAFELVFGPQGIGGIMRSTWGSYGVTLVFYFLLFYGVFSAALKKVKIFEGEGALGLNSAGKMFAIAVSGLSCLSIFAFKDASESFIRGVLSPLGIWGGMALGIIFFIFMYKQFKDGGSAHPRSWALLLTGVLLFASGTLISEPNVLPAIGIIMIIIGIISFFMGIRRGQAPVTTHEEGTAEHQDRRLGNLETAEQNRIDPRMLQEARDAAQRRLMRQQIIEELARENADALRRLP